MSTRPHGLNENHSFLLVAVVIIAFMVFLSAGNPELPLAELTGKLLHRLGLYLTTVTLVLAFLGGWRWQLVEQMKNNLIAFAILAASIIFGAAEVLSH
jgi:uncharacterized membrane protein YidH (DUF202 family)